MNECVFCKIIDKEIPSYTIYEDDLVIAFLDLNQECPGHILIVPKNHILDIYDINEETISHIYKVVLKMSDLLKEKLNYDGLTLLQNNGIAQDIKHFHLHILPKYKSKPNLKIEQIYNILH